MNLRILIDKFNTHEKCLKHLTVVKWGDTITCTHCTSDRITKRSLKSNGAQKRTVPLYHCNKCNKDFSVLTNTIYESTKLPLQYWFFMISAICNAKKGVSSLQLSRDLGITQKTAWCCYMKIRQAMVEHTRDLSGIVEMDITYVGGKPRYRYNKKDLTRKPFVKGLRGKGTKKAPVVAIVERRGRATIKMMTHNPKTNELLDIFKSHVEVKDANLMTDEGSEFIRFNKIVKHETVNHDRKEYARGNVHTNSVEGFFGILKNSLKGNFHRVSKNYLPLYLAEYVYKYNRRHQQKLSFNELLKDSLFVVKQIVNYQPTQSPLKIAYGHDVRIVQN